jgi:hypothetical protein
MTVILSLNEYTLEKLSLACGRAGTIAKIIANFKLKIFNLKFAMLLVAAKAAL